MGRIRQLEGSGGACSFSGMVNYFADASKDQRLIGIRQRPHCSKHFYLFRNDIGTISPVNRPNRNHSGIFSNVHITAYNSLEPVYYLCRNKYRIH